VAEQVDEDEVRDADEEREYHAVPGIAVHKEDDGQEVEEREYFVDAVS